MVVIAGFAGMLSGCGGGGYAGIGITSLSKSTATIDAGQSFSVAATNPTNLPLTWTASGANCSGAGCGTVAAGDSSSSVIYTAPTNVSTPITVTLTAMVSGTQSTKVVTITVNPALAITGNTPSGVVGTSYSATVSSTGGTTPVTLSLVAGTLPPGLTFDPSTGRISGTPTVAGTSNFTIQAVDRSDVVATVTSLRQITITAAGAALTVSGNPPAGVVGTAYSSTLQAAGGTQPYSWAVSSGALPAGLTLSTSGVISGNPTTVGSSTFVASATDATGTRASASFTIAVTAGASNGTLAITTGTLPNGTVSLPYNATIGVSGGTGPYTCSIVTGTLPAGLSLGAGCAVSGTPTATGTSPLTVRATDSSNPALSTTGNVSITIAASGLGITSVNLPSGTVGTVYSAPLPITGGTMPYTCTVTGGTLPAGLTLGANCTVTGTPTTAGTSTPTITIKDASNPQQTITPVISITINPVGLALSSGTLPNGTVGTVYSAILPVTGGTSPYTCTLASGTLPAGLTLGTNCTVSGTPTTAGTSTPTITVHDSSSPQQTITPTVSITIAPPALGVSSSTLPSGTVGITYTQTIPVTGGTGPYTCTLASGTLPAGLTLGANCSVSGTPTTAGTSTPVISIHDASNPQQTITPTVSITIAPATLTVTAGPLPGGTVGTVYTQPIPVTGGTGPYTCTVASGTLPAGLTLGANCSVSGTPTTAGTSTPVISIHDSSNPQQTITPTVSVTIAPSALGVGNSTLPSGTVGVVYTQPIPVTGGTGPYTCTVSSGTLPAGLTLGANCTVSGTPTTAGTSTPVISIHDSSNPQQTITPTVSITIAPAALTVSSGTLPPGTVGVVYTQPIAVTGGTGPYTCTLSSGTLPAGLTLGANCTVSGTPTTAGTSTPVISIHDSSNPQQTITPAIGITINPSGFMVTNGTLPNGTVGTLYSQTIPIVGGTAPYTCVLASGAMPPGLTVNANCTVTGTPSATGTYSPTLTIKDTSNPQQTITSAISITIDPSALAVSNGTLPAGTVGTVYTATIPVTGGTAPYTCTLTSGTLPAGLTLGANCAVSGTPTTAGTSTPTITIHDSSNPQQTITPVVSITVNPSALAVSNGTLPAGTVGTVYTATIPVTGGTAPYTCTLTSGTLPAGLTLGANCAVSGTPTTAGTSTPTITIHDSSNPQQTITPVVSITVNPAPLTVGTGSLPGGTVGVPYTQTIPVSGGTGPYTCTVTSGTLPAGLTLGAGCTVTGTPTTAGTSTPTITIHDSANPPQTITPTIGIAISPAALVLGTGALPNGTVGTTYTATLPVSGGTAPYTCTLGAGTLPAGLTLGAGCTVTGTPTTAGTSTPTINVSDSGNPALTTAGPVSITIAAAPSTLVISSPTPATVNVPYTGTIPVTGGTGPYTCQVVSGTVPGLTVNGNCSITGTPTTPGATPITVTVTDSSQPAATKTGTATITVNAATTTLTLTSPATATVTVPYTGTIGVTGGTGPYTCTVPAGTMPAGLTLNANCSVTGTPTTVAVTNVNVTATDSANPANVTTAPVTITVQAIPALTLTGSLPNAIVGVAYTQTLQAAGGVGPYTYTVTAGALPNGLSLATNGTISGTPTAPGASSFTITATDSEGTPKTASLPLVLLVVYPTTPDDAKLKGQYAYLFQGNDDILLGVFAYRTATAASFTADGTGVVSAGEMDSNHQTSLAPGNTIATREFLGTYTIGTDLRGSLTLSTLAADGTVQSTNTYAIALRAPVSPVTVSAVASMVQFDSNQLGGTKGSGTMLLQDTTKFAAGLTGSYVFGLQGDAPCFPTCTVGLVAGPAASVGQFTATGGTISGTGDANLAATNFAQSTLTGSYGSADANGRVQLSMATSKLNGVPFPTDYAVYVVDASHLFVLSTDKHSSFVLQAGTAQLQTQATFDATSMGAPYVGYENSPVNPGLVGGTLQSVASLSSATIFRGSGNGAGICTTTNVDTGGTTGLVNAIAGAVGGGAPLIGDLLGTYQTTGSNTCAVAANGRTVLNYPPPGSILTNLLALLGVQAVTPAPRILYLVSPNNGYFLESSYAGIGTIEPQVGSPFTTATLNGVFVYDQVPASTIATLRSSGNFTADGAGNATSTLDENIGVGTLNVLQLGVTGSTTYTLRDAIAGRYTLGAYGTIYAIAPGRFVLLQTDAVGTSPYIALLY
ncbi:beta strand repeat-containing protein [Terriglobus roseus]|nr:putative Ig domain-containing protein [Terriglobus roseus]